MKTHESRDWFYYLVILPFVWSVPVENWLRRRGWVK